MMKKIIFLLATIIPSVLFAQSGKYHIKGKIGTYSSPAKVYLQYSTANSFVTDSVILDNGNFEFHGEAQQSPVSAYLRFAKDGKKNNRVRDDKEFYLEKGNILVTDVDGTMANSKITGTQTNLDLIEYEKLNEPAQAIRRVLISKMRQLSDKERSTPEFKEFHLTESTKMKALEDKAGMEFIKKFPNSYHSLILLKDMLYGHDYAELNPLYTAFSAPMKNSSLGERIGIQLTGMKNVAIGAIAPDFTLPDTSGKAVSLSSLRGKYILVDLWASWCGPCRAENPNLVKTYERFKGDKFDIIGVSLDRSTGKAQWQAAIKKDGLTWMQVSDLKFWDSEVVKKYGISGIPQNFLLDPSGRVIARSLRGEDLDKKLESILGKGKMEKSR